MVLSSYPVGICFSGNLPLFVGTASPTEVITVQLKKGAEIILEDSFNPDENGNLSVDYSKVVDGLLSIKVPPFVAGSYIQTDAVAQLTATFTSSNGTDVETIVFNVVKGGVAGLADHAMFLASNFLTWQPQTKEVKYHDPEFLSYYAAVAVTVKLKAYYSNSNEVVNVANLTANNLHTVNLNYGSVASLLSGQALYYDVWVEDAGGNALTSVQRYVLIDKVFDYESILLFENSVGGIDTIRLTGQIEEKNTATLSSGLFDDFVFEFDTQPERAFTINSGYLKSEREKQWSVELLNSIQKYLIIDGALTSVYSDKPEFTAIKGELPFFEITLLCSHKTKYLNLARQTNPLPNLTISTNTGGVFFLAPRLNDLPWANSNDVLLPVQFPYENFFRKVSLSSILSGAGGGITVEKDPTVPNHVKAITLTQINKWDNAATSSDHYTKTEIAAILNGSPSLPGYNKSNWDVAFGWGNHTGLYQPIENQRLSTTEAVNFRGIHAQDFQSIPTAAPAPADRVPGRVYIYSAGSGGGSGTPPPVHGTLVGLQDVDATGLANGFIPYYDAASGKFKFMANNFGSIAWTSISGRPTHLSNFVNDLGNYGNWITKLDGDGWFAPLAGYNKSLWDNASSLSHSHANKDFLDSVVSGATLYLNVSGTSENLTIPVGTYKHVGAWGVGLTDNGAILVNSAYYSVIADQAGNSTQWSGQVYDGANKAASFSDFMAIGTNAQWGYISRVDAKTALNISDGSTLNNNITGNAGTVSNGVYTYGSYSNPSWIISLAYGKLTGAPTALSQFANDLGLSAVYQPIENQRLSTGDAVTHRGIHAQDFQSIPTAAPAPADRVPGRVYIYSAGSGGGSGTPPPIHGTLIGLQDVDAAGLANGYIPYYDAPSGKFKFMANNFGSIAWTAVTGRPTHLSNFVNDLGNYGNWITKLDGDGWFAPLAGYNKSLWDNAASLSHSHANKAFLDSVVSGATLYLNVSGTSENLTTPVGTYKHVGAWGVELTDNGAILVNSAYYSVNAGQSGNSTLWNGLQYNNASPTTTPLYFMASADGGTYGYTPLANAKTALNISDGSTLNNNISGSAAKWGGLQLIDVIKNDATPYLIGYNVDDNSWRPTSMTGLKSSLGLTTSSYNLQWVSGNGNYIDKSPTNSYPTLGVLGSEHLSISQNGRAYGGLFGVSNDGNLWIQSQSFYSSSAYNIILNPAGGNVGIGTTSPSYKLDVNGGLSAQRIVAGYDSGVAGSINTNEYLRTIGNGGVWWATHNVGIETNNSSYPMVYSYTNASGFRIATDGGVLRGYVAANNSNEIGFLNGAGDWNLRVTSSGDVHSNSFYASSWFRSSGDSGWYSETHGGGIYMTDSTWLRVYANKSFLVNNTLYASRIWFDEDLVGQNFGSGLVGQYSATRYQSVFSMGAAYKMALDGTVLNNHYGIAWTYEGLGQAKAGLGHQMLITEAGITQTAIGNGIWTRANIEALGVVKAGTGYGFQNIGYQAGRNRIWSFSNADNYGLSYHQGGGSIYGMDGIGIHFGDANTPQFNFKQDGAFSAIKKVTAPTVEATAALAIPSGPPPVHLRESGKSYIYSAS